MNTVKRINLSYFPPETDKSTILTKTGMVLDNICYKAIADEDDVTCNYVLEAEFLIDEFGVWQNIQEEGIIKAKLDYGYEIFQIISKRINQRDLSIVARQITISRSLGLFLKDVRPTNLSGQGALSHMLVNSQGKKNDIILKSDIETTYTAYYKDKNLHNALYNTDNCFTSVWGGETTRRQFTISINKTKGSNRGVVLRRGKNLTGFEGNTNIDNICTRIIAKGFNGIDAGVYIDSPLIDNYSNIYTKEFKYDNVKVKSEGDEEGYDTLEQAQEELIRLAKLEFSENKIDEIKGDYRINFVHLEQTEEYKDFISSERVFVGDIITVIEEKLGVSLEVRAIRRKYNILSQKTIETELSNTPLKEKKASSTSNIIINIKNELDGNTISDYIQNMINSGATDSYVLYRQNEILAMDNKDINAAINVVRLNKHGLAFSQTGYYGEYVYGYTIDGVFNASLIQTGELNASLIKVGTITGKNGNLQMSIEDDYFEMVHNKSTTKTRIDANGFYILNEQNETIASLASEDSWSELKADKVFARNVENIYLGDANLYVDHSYIGETLGTIDKPFNSFEQLRNHLESNPIINTNIKINVMTTSSEITETLVLNGLKGYGSITITYDKQCIHRTGYNGSWCMYFTNFQIPFGVTGGRSSYNSNDGAILCDTGNAHGIFIKNCVYVDVYRININCKNWGVRVINSKVRGANIDFCSTYCAYEIDSASIVSDKDSVGNCGDFFRVYGGSIFMYGDNGNGYRPIGNKQEYSGKHFLIGTERTATGSFRTKPPVPPTSNYERGFSITSLGTYQYKWGTWSAGEAKQGTYGSYGNKSGHLFFDIGSIRSFIGTGTVLDGNTITLTRRNAGGSSGATNIYINASTSSGSSGTPGYSHTTYLGTLSWGQTRTFTLPKSIVNALKSGAANSLACYSTGDPYAYAEIVNASIVIKVNK